MKSHYAPLSLVLFASAFSPVHATASYSIDFSTAKSSPGNWNNIGSADDASFVLTEFDSGTQDGATLSRVGLSSDSNITEGWTAGDVGWMTAVAGSDGFYSASTASISISGLAQGTYRVMLVAAESESEGNFPSTADFQIGGAFSDDDRLSSTATSDDWNTETDGLNNWMTWSSVSTSGALNDTITININATNFGFTTVNALRLENLTLVPEPSSAILLLVASLGTLHRRRN